MKTPTDNVFQLIHSMTAAEKRYFKRHYSSTKSITTELFDYLNGMGKYDETIVKKHFFSSRISKNLKVHKVQLSDLLLKSLTSYHNKKSVRSKIRIGLEEVEILMSKQLYEPAKSKLNKIKEVCKSHEEVCYMPAIIALENQIYNFYGINHSNKPWEQYTSETQQYSQTLDNIFRLNSFNFSLKVKEGNHSNSNLEQKDLAFFKNFIETEEDNRKNPKHTFLEKFLTNLALAYSYKVLYQDLDKEIFFHKENIQLFEDNPNFIDSHFHNYFILLYHYLSACFKSKNKELFSTILKKLKSHVETFPILERNHLFISYLELKCYFQSNKFLEITDVMESQIKEKVDKYGLENEMITLSNYNVLACTYLALGNQKEVQFYLRRMQRIASENSHVDYKKYLVILDLICHYESKDFQLMNNITQAQRRKIKKSDNVPRFLNQLIQFFVDLVKVNDSDKPKLANDLLVELRQVMEIDFLKDLIVAMGFKEWLRAIINGQSYSNWKKNRVIVPN